VPSKSPIGDEWIDLTPRAKFTALGRGALQGFLHSIIAYAKSVSGGVDEAEVESMRRSFVRSLQGIKPQERVRIEAFGCLLSDLGKQGWALKVDGERVEGRRPVMDPAFVRDSRRRLLGSRRNEQLREPATREFVVAMERGHLFNGRRVSIFSLFRDGRELACALELYRQHPETIPSDLPIRPYVQIAERPATCKLTGFELTDIWRYFRHTWSTPYESVPGRTMPILIRDAATPHHAIIGISALSSAASVLPVRDDQLIRWSGDAFLLDAATATPHRAQRLMSWLDAFVDRSTKQVFRLDLVEEGILPSRLPEVTSAEVIKELLTISKRARNQHVDLSRDRDIQHVKGRGDAEDEFWEKQARSPLFRSKRAAELADLLAIRNELKVQRKKLFGAKRFSALISTSAGRRLVSKVVRKARAESIGSAIADLAVCGAVAPYNELIGGKLVALLSVSPTVVKMYKRRYSGSASVIGSSMAGRRVIRRADLVYIGTTSLYGIRPNQYDRARIPRSILGAKNDEKFGFSYLGDTQGYGTSQFGESTKIALGKLVQVAGNGTTINNLFGEGANPRLRALRDGLEELGVPEELLVHGMEKSVYGVSMLESGELRDYLLAVRAVPKYVFPKKASRFDSDAIARYWFGRWALNRLARPETLDALRKHSLVYPIRHGARLVLPNADLDQLGLFCKLE
jgi:hypothetical protein